MTEATGGDESPNRLVVGVDGSTGSIEALRWARYLAENIDADIEAIMAWQVPKGWNDDGWIDDTNPQQEAHRTLHRSVAAVFGSDPRPHVTETTLMDSPTAALITASKSATMVLVGSRGHGGVSGLLLGSVSSAVAEKASCPVVVVHGYTLPHPRR